MIRNLNRRAKKRSFQQKDLGTLQHTIWLFYKLLQPDEETQSKELRVLVIRNKQKNLQDAFLLIFYC